MQLELESKMKSSKKLIRESANWTLERFVGCLKTGIRKYKKISFRIEPRKKRIRSSRFSQKTFSLIKVLRFLLEFLVVFCLCHFEIRTTILFWVVFQKFPWGQRIYLWFLPFLRSCRPGSDQEDFCQITSVSRMERGVTMGHNLKFYLTALSYQ